MCGYVTEHVRTACFLYLGCSQSSHEGRVDTLLSKPLTSKLPFPFKNLLRFLFARISDFSIPSSQIFVEGKDSRVNIDFKL